MFSSLKSSFSKPASSRANCPNSDKICFVCAQFIPPKSVKPLSPTNRKVFEACYGDISRYGAGQFYSPTKFCSTCLSDMTRYSKNQKADLKFRSPTVWNQPNHAFATHEESCYLCLSYRIQANPGKPAVSSHPSRSNVTFPVANYLASDFRPDTPDSLDLPDFQADFQIDSQSDSQSDDSDPPFDPSEYYFYFEGLTGDKDSLAVQLYNYAKLNDLIRRLDLSKEKAMILASDLKSNNLLEKGCLVTYYEKRNHEIVHLFKKLDASTPYLADIDGLFQWLGYEYKASEWRLFIDSNLNSLKCVLLHNTNKLPSIPILYSRSLKESREDIALALRTCKYDQHEWQVVADLKLLNIMCGVGTASSRHPCVLCTWYGTHRRDLDKQYFQSDILPRSCGVQIGTYSQLDESLIKLKNVIIPPLHIKLGLISQFIKKLDNGGEAFDFLGNLFEHKSEAKLLAGILNGPDIRKLLQNSADFCQVLSDREKAAFLSFESLCKNFLGKKRSPNYKEIAKDLVENYYHMGCNMSYKLHLIDSHIDEMAPNCGDYSDEMGERFHQDIMSIEERYQGRYNEWMLSDYCWFLKRETVLKSRKGSGRQYFPPTGF